ncbi:MAG: hypothetical protein LUE93_05125 [Bacteroides sp.]|nr:hypothetical protein [Bacteroides sp.]
MKWNVLIGYLDIIVYILLAIPLLYSFIFAWISIRNRHRTFSFSGPENRILLILLGENENKLLPEDYLSGQALSYDICLVAREELKKKKSWKNLAVTYIDPGPVPVKYNLQEFLQITKKDDYDIVLILEEENILPPDFLIRINQLYNSGIKALQIHRTPDEPEDDKTLLKAIIQEINFAVLCNGHVKAGLSSGITASGIMLDYN